MKEAIGEIDCPLCKRVAELHASESRQKLDPDATDGAGKPAYPKKYFVVCPPVSGYRGCGTILCNSPGAQSRLMELGRIFGPGGRAQKKQTTPEPSPAPAPVAPAVAPAAKAASNNPFKFW